MDIKLQDKTTNIDVGRWSASEGMTTSPGYELAKVKRFFRVGVVLGQPWAWIEGAEDPTSKFKCCVSFWRFILRFTLHFT